MILHYIAKLHLINGSSSLLHCCSRCYSMTLQIDLQSRSFKMNALFFTVIVLHRKPQCFIPTVNVNHIQKPDWLSVFASLWDVLLDMI